MPNRLIEAVKENKNDIRKKLVIAAGITVAAVAVGVVLAKVASQQTDLVFVLPEGTTIEDALEALPE